MLRKPDQFLLSSQPTPDQWASVAVHGRPHDANDAAQCFADDLAAPAHTAGRRREMVLTVPPGGGRRRHRSFVGQTSNERPHHVSPKPANFMCSRQRLHPGAAAPIRRRRAAHRGPPPPRARCSGARVGEVLCWHASTFGVPLPWLASGFYGLRGNWIVNSLYSPTLLSTVMPPPCCWVTMS